MKPRTSFTVVATYTAECCAKPHLWVQTVVRASAGRARRKVLADMRAAEVDPSEIVVVDWDAKSTRPIHEL